MSIADRADPTDDELLAEVADLSTAQTMYGGEGWVTADLVQRRLPRELRRASRRPRRPMRTYVALTERTIESDVGDTAFVLLGYYEAPDATSARRLAAAAHGIPSSSVVVVSSHYWR